jgi:hypothetical protein
MRLSDLEPRFICSACGKRGADVRPELLTGEQALEQAKAFARAERDGKLEAC